jgi:hypothetical protein
MSVTMLLMADAVMVGVAAWRGDGAGAAADGVMARQGVIRV